MGVVDWVEDPATDARDAHYKKARSVCATFLAPRPLGTIPGALSFAFAVDDAHALLGTRSGSLAIASQDGLTSIDPPIPGYVRGAFSDGTKVYLSEWFSPRMYRGDPSPVAGVVNVEPLPDSPLPMGAYALAGGDGKIIAVSEEGQAAWFDGTAWTSLPPFNVNDSLVRASWTPDESFYWSRGGGGLTRVDPTGAPSAENFEAGVYSIETIEELGTVLGTEDGKLFQRAMLRWGGLGGDYGWWVVDLESYAGGFFFLLASGSVGQYRVDPDSPLCPDQLIATYINDGRIVRMGRSLIVAGWDANLPTDVYYVEF
jgi:hypothetical protein